MKDKIFKNVFLAPAIAAYEKSETKRKSKIISDCDFLEMGIKRVMSYYASGRNFIQVMIDKFNFKTLTVDNFFKSLSSKRRLKLLKEINENIVKDYVPIEHNNPFKDKVELDGYALYAADGHFHKHASHEKKIEGKNYPVGHIYVTNLRTTIVQHLDVLRPENKKESEIHALKRLGGQALRMGEPLGKKVIIVYDKAIVDFQEWHKWKQSKGVYVLTREKSNMQLISCGDFEFDKSDPVNAGVTSDQQVGHSHGRMIRRIIYTDPLSGKEYKFITNILNVAPGLIAYIYKVRWNIEKTFQQFKTNYHEKKAWATSDEAKSIQAIFLCIVYNLMLILEDKVELEENIVDQKIREKQKKRIEQNTETLKKKNLKINPMILTVKKSLMRSCQFIRLIEIVFNDLTSWSTFIAKLRPRMECYL